MSRTTALRAFGALHDLGAAAWLGGALMGASGLNAAADAAGPARDEVVSAGWTRWTPWFRAAAALNLAGAAGRLALRRDASTAIGLGLTTAALGTTAGAAALGARADSAESGGSTQVVHALEWAVPALLAAAVITRALGSR